MCGLHTSWMAGFQSAPIATRRMPANVGLPKRRHPGNAPFPHPARNPYGLAEQGVEDAVNCAKVAILPLEVNVMKILPKLFLVLSVFVASAPEAFAHTFGIHGAGFAEGLAHPFLGLDHLLAMLAVGVWAAQLGGAALWRLPLAFVAAMVGGAVLAVPSVDAASMETAIAVSVLVLGLAVALALRLPERLGLSLVAAFALCHGFAHGLEMPQAAEPWAYGLGFLSATASLHLFGVLLGLSLRRAPWAARVGGAAVAAAGVLLLAV